MGSINLPWLSHSLVKTEYENAIWSHVYNDCSQNVTRASQANKGLHLPSYILHSPVC